MKKLVHRIRIDKRKSIASFVLGTFFACSSILGKVIEGEGERALDIWLCVEVCGTILGIALFIYGSWTLLERAAEKRRKKAYSDKKYPLLSSFWGRTALILAMWLPCFLAIFPGSFSYDAFEQWRQVKEWDLSTIHPVLHTLLVGVCVEGGFQLFGSYNAGIFCYTVLQMSVLAIIFSAAIAFLERFRVPPAVRFIALFYWGGVACYPNFCGVYDKGHIFFRNDVTFFNVSDLL